MQLIHKQRGDRYLPMHWAKTREKGKTSVTIGYLDIVLILFCLATQQNICDLRQCVLEKVIDMHLDTNEDDDGNEE